MAHNMARRRACAELARRYAEEYSELYAAEYPIALAEQRAKEVPPPSRS
jgi:hypothetical protein